MMLSYYAINLKFFKENYSSPMFGWGSAYLLPSNKNKDYDKDVEKEAL